MKNVSAALAFLLGAAMPFTAAPAQAGWFSDTPAEKAADYAEEMSDMKQEIEAHRPVSNEDRMVLFAIHDGLNICVRASKAENLFQGCDRAYQNFRKWADKAGR